MKKVIVAYDHDPADLGLIELGIGDDVEKVEFQPALRDTVSGSRVVWIRSEDEGTVWLRDRDGVRKVRR